MIIGLSGYARSGKDTIGKILIEDYGFEQRSFAQPLKDALLVVNPIIKGELRIADVVGAYGWEAAKAYPEVRELLQRFGTDFGRNMIGEFIWADMGVKGLTSDSNVVFTDCRFISEAMRVTSLGGSMWRVTREGYGPVNSHASEVGLDDWRFDQHLFNFGTIDELRIKVRAAMSDEFQR